MNYLVDASTMHQCIYYLIVDASTMHLQIHRCIYYCIVDKSMLHLLIVDASTVCLLHSQQIYYLIVSKMHLLYSPLHRHRIYYNASTIKQQMHRRCYASTNSRCIDAVMPLLINNRMRLLLYSRCINDASNDTSMHLLFNSRCIDTSTN